MISLYQAFQSIQTQDEFDDFITDLCSPSEIRELNARWKVAQMLWNASNERLSELNGSRNRKSAVAASKSGLTQREIAKIANVSLALINRVAKCLFENTDNGYKNILTKSSTAKQKASPKKN